MENEKTYRIGEVAEMLNLKTYVLRFWETEFPQLAPERTESGQRLYTLADVGILRRIRQLLHAQGMTIEGARRVLAGEDPEDADEDFIKVEPDFVDMITEELSAIGQLLKDGS